MNIEAKTILPTLLAAGLMLSALAFSTVPAVAQEDEQRIIKKEIRIHCDGEDCDEHPGHGMHKFAWMSGDGPGRYVFGTGAGGGFLGVQLAELTPELRAHFGVEESAGVMVSKVIEDSPAARAGLQVGDIVTAVDGDAIGSGRSLAMSIRGKEDGSSVLLEVWRDRKVQSLTAVIEERAGEVHSMKYAFVMKCDEYQEDCEFATKHLERSELGTELDCEGDRPCKVEVRCDDAGECDCTMNGEPVACEGLPGFDN